MRSLPIDPLLPKIIDCFAHSSRLVLRAPPGAGKTTRIPAALLDAGLAGTRQVVVLEPRRIVARAVAEYVAHERGGSIGGEVGYKVRFEQRGGPATRLWFLTEGVLGRQLVHDPFLEPVGVAVLDEFHERHLQGDVALAVIRELQESVRPDLKLLVMSATLQTDRLATYLGGCPVLTSEGREYPVAIEYEAIADDRPLAGRIASALRRILTDTAENGDILVFLPGAAEIRRAAEAVAPLAAAHDLAVVPLHGDLSLDAQQRAIRPAAQRKVVLSTNVAETALTIEGVTTVIDSGLARVARLDPKHGINALRVVPISRAAAAQRAGRAGRTAPGRCLRLWTAAEQAHRREAETPEIIRLDLSPTVLELRAWGLSDPLRFAWLDPPGEAALRHAERLLAALGAVEPETGALTDIGRRLLDLSVHPRLGRMLVEAERRGCRAAGGLLAALASERDICLEQRALSGQAASHWPAGPSDLLLRMELFENAARRGFDPQGCRSLGLDPRGVRAVERAHRQLARVVGADAAGGKTRRHSRESGNPVVPRAPLLDARLRGHDEPDGSPAGSSDSWSDPGEADTMLRCILAGFPDRVVRRRAPGSSRGVMVGGTGVVLSDSSVVRDAELFVAVEVDAGAQRQVAEARVRLASAVQPEWLREMFRSALHEQRELVFDADRERVVERTRTLYHDLTLSEMVRTDVDPLLAGDILAEAARRDPARAATVGESERNLLERIRFLARWMPELEFPAETDALLADAVAALCAGRRSFAEVQRAELLPVVRGMLASRQLRALDREAPSRYPLPSGRQATVHYERDKPPAVGARIQELFGLTATPRLAAGRVALVFQLLAPNQRPVQITDDLESFWRNTYPEVRKQLRARYPKHDWPEDPFTATPTSRTI